MISPVILALTHCFTEKVKKLYRIGSWVQIIKIEDNDDEEKRMAKIFDIYELVLIRPDRYVYGGIKSMQETSNIIEELEKTFSLKI